jgi:riboflavin transporter FmnP
LLLLLLLCRRHHLLFLSMLSGLSTSFVLFALLPSPSYVRWDITRLPSFAYLLTSIRGDIKKLLRLLVLLY